VYQFDVGSQRNAAKVVWKGYATNADTFTIQAWNFTGTPGWDTRATITGTNATTNVTKDVSLLAAHTGTGAEAGDVYIRIYATGQSAIVVRTDEMLVAGVSVGSTTGYSDGAVWVKAVANGGTAGTTPDVNGTADHPCPWADAIVVATAKGLTRFRIANGETVTLDASTEAKSLLGQNWTLALGGQSISGSFIMGAAVSGTGTGASPPMFKECWINAGTTLPPSNFDRCGINTTSGSPLTAGSAGNFNFVDCFSLVAGSGVPYFTLSGACNISFRRWSGGSYTTLNSSDTEMTMEVLTGGGQTIVVGGANVEIRGFARSITLSGITSNSTCQIDCVTGPITLAGSSGTVNVYGICSSVTDSRDPATGLNTYADLDVTTNAIKTKTDFLPSYTAGNANGLFIAGVNASCTITDVATAGSVGKYLKDILDDTAVLPATWVVPGVGTSTLTTTDVQTYCDAAITANTLVKDIPSTSEFEARTLLAAGYATPINITSATGIQLAASQHVIVDSGTVTVSDKTGFKLASDGLDTVAITAPTGAASNFREMLVQVWRRFFRKATRTDSAIITYADNGTTPVTTQVISNDGTTETQGTAT
jgi:hypothetical protein